jgi:hypothetical protein
MAGRGRDATFCSWGRPIMPDRVLRAMHIAMEDHRSSDFPKLTLPLRRPQRRVKTRRPGRHLSSSGAWEAALTNPPGARCAARFGQFSHLWIELARRHGLRSSGGGVGHWRQPTGRGGSAPTRTTIGGVMVCARDGHRRHQRHHRVRAMDAADPRSYVDG